MSDVLSRICANKQAEIEERRSAVPLAELADRARKADPVRGFAARLRDRIAAGEFALIAEIKHASPSEGIIREDFDPGEIARAYRDGGATCLSVLTDEPYFHGSDAHLAAARDAVGLPILRKDFTLDPYQVVEARAIGADCILLIMAALDDRTAAALEATAMDYDLDVLVEVHNEEELERALQLRSPLIGINNRDLKTLRTDLEVTERLAPAVPEDRIIVCESGLETHDNLSRMGAAGAFCFLVGTSLVKEADVASATRTLLYGAPRRRANA